MLESNSDVQQTGYRKFEVQIPPRNKVNGLVKRFSLPNKYKLFQKEQASSLNKRSCLAAALGVAEFITDIKT